jgi:hypothetical protein
VTNFFSINITFYNGNKFLRNDFPLDFQFPNTQNSLAGQLPTIQKFLAAPLVEISDISIYNFCFVKLSPSKCEYFL